MFSDYYEKFFAYAFAQLKHLPDDCPETYKKIQMACDDIVPYIYVTYFHILTKIVKSGWKKALRMITNLYIIFQARKWDSYKNNKGRKIITFRYETPENHFFKYAFPMPVQYIKYSDVKDNKEKYQPAPIMTKGIHK